MDVSIIIVNYNTKDLIKNCINSIYKHTKDVDFEIIVSDNGSVDGSIEMIKSEFPNVILIENGSNLGFGTANNRGLAIAKGKYIFYLIQKTAELLPAEIFGTYSMRLGLVIEYATQHGMNTMMTNLEFFGFNIENLTNKKTQKNASAVVCNEK